MRAEGDSAWLDTGCEKVTDLQMACSVCSVQIWSKRYCARSTRRSSRSCGSARSQIHLCGLQHSSCTGREQESCSEGQAALAHNSTCLSHAELAAQTRTSAARHTSSRLQSSPFLTCCHAVIAAGAKGSWACEPSSDASCSTGLAATSAAMGSNSLPSDRQ